MSTVSSGTFASLCDRRVLVTGGARGLGREMALALAEAGARVMVTAARDTPELAETVAAGRAAAGVERFHGLVADVTDPAACARAVAETLDAIGGIDVLINNAGRGMLLISPTYNREPTRFWEADPEAWRTIVDTNLNGTFYMTRAAVPHMLAQKFGKVINISTSEQTMVRRGYSPYGPSKAALEAASRVWAQDLAGTGVDVNIYLPGGAADTDLLADGPDKRGADGNLLPAAIMRRAILWLAADESNGVTGQRFVARLWDDLRSPLEALAAAGG